MKVILQKVLKTFPYSPDGITTVMLQAETEHDIRADLVNGLRAAGYVGDPDPPQARGEDPPRMTMAHGPAAENTARAVVGEGGPEVVRLSDEGQESRMAKKRGRTTKPARGA